MGTSSASFWRQDGAVGGAAPGSRGSEAEARAGCWACCFALRVLSLEGESGRLGASAAGANSSQSEMNKQKAGEEGQSHDSHLPQSGEEVTGGVTF